MYKKTFSKECQESLQQELEIIYPWSCKNKDILSLNYDGLLADLKTYWNQEARFREGFEFTEDTVTIPNFFTKINGELKSKREQKKLEKFLTSAKDTLYFDSIKAFSETLITEQLEDKYYVSHLGTNDENLQLLAQKLNCPENKVQEHLKCIYDHTPYLFIRLSPFIKKQCCKSLQELVHSSLDIVNKNSFGQNLLILNDCYVELLNNYDYAFNLPKIVIKEQKDELFSDAEIGYLFFFNLLGFDIVILNPYGKNDFNSYLDINEIKLDTIKKKVNKVKKSRIRPISILNGVLSIIYFVSISSFVNLIIKYAKEEISGSFCGGAGLIIIFSCIAITFVCFDYRNKINQVLFKVSISVMIGIGLIALIGFDIMHSEKYQLIEGEYEKSKADIKNEYNIEIIDKKEHYVGVGNKGYLNSNTGDLYLIVTSPAENEENYSVKIFYKKQTIVGGNSDSTVTIYPFKYKRIFKTDLTLPQGEYTFDCEFTFSQGIFKDDIILKRTIPITSISDEEFDKLL